MYDAIAEVRGADTRDPATVQDLSTLEFLHDEAIMEVGPWAGPLIPMDVGPRTAVHGVRKQGRGERSCCERGCVSNVFECTRRFFGAGSIDVDASIN